MRKFMDKVQAGALDLTLDYVLKSPAKNFSMLVDWAERFNVSENIKTQLR